VEGRSVSNSGFRSGGGIGVVDGSSGSASLCSEFVGDDFGVESGFIGEVVHGAVTAISQLEAVRSLDTSETVSGFLMGVGSAKAGRLITVGVRRGLSVVIQIGSVSVLGAGNGSKGDNGKCELHIGR